MFKLIQNENMKLYGRVRTWVLLSLLFVMVVLGSISTQWFSSAFNPEIDWRGAVQSKLQNEASSLSQSEIRLLEYQLKHDIPPLEYTVWNGVMAGDLVLGIITIFLIVIAADLVASEFSRGTIKLLLLQPVTRGTVLLSKYLAMLLFMLLMLAVVMLINLIISVSFLGFSSIGEMYAGYLFSGQTITVMPAFLYVLLQYGLAALKMVIIATIAFMFSSLLRSSGGAQALTILIYIFGPWLPVFFGERKWIDYYMFTHMNFPTPYPLPLTIAVLGTYYALFMLVAWFSFNRRDVK